MCRRAWPLLRHLRPAIYCHPWRRAATALAASGRPRRAADRAALRVVAEGCGQKEDYATADDHGQGDAVVAKVEWHPGELFPRVGFMWPSTISAARRSSTLNADSITLYTQTSAIAPTMQTQTMRPATALESSDLGGHGGS